MLALWTSWGLNVISSTAPDDEKPKVSARRHLRPEEAAIMDGLYIYSEIQSALNNGPSHHPASH
jgi:hypothetical protein